MKINPNAACAAGREPFSLYTARHSVREENVTNMLMVENKKILRRPGGDQQCGDQGRAVVDNRQDSVDFVRRFDEVMPIDLRIFALKNSDNLLPVNLGKHKKIAFVGPNAAVSIANGGGSVALAAHYVTTPLKSFKQAVESDSTISVTHTQGIHTNRYVPLLDINQVRDPLTGTAGFSLQFWKNMTHSGDVVFKSIRAIRLSCVMTTCQNL